jgi:hypothetical protein
MENGEQLAFAMLDPNGNYTQYGLTKREYFAGLAMQGVMASLTEMQSMGGSILHHVGLDQVLAKEAVCIADALLAELEQLKQQEQ